METDEVNDPSSLGTIVVDGEPVQSAPRASAELCHGVPVLRPLPSHDVLRESAAKSSSEKCSSA
jgi:hypothetical protein